MLKTKLNIVLLVLLLQQAFPQATNITIGNGIVCPGDEVTIPVFVYDFVDIGAFTLFIGYDTSVLIFTGHSNEHVETPGIFSNAMVEPTSQVGLSWSSLNPADIISGKLVDLQFQYISENTNLTFNPGCELVSSSLIIIEHSITNGSVSQSDPLIILEPLDGMADIGDDVDFNIDASNVMQYQWQKSDDQGSSWIDVIDDQHYWGVTTNLLHVVSVTYQMDNTIFRCKVCHNECCIYSESATLIVNPSTAFELEKLENNKFFSISPNPITSESEICILLNKNGHVKIQVFDLLGNCIAELNQKQQAGEHRFLWRKFAINTGIYFCSCALTIDESTKICIEKIIVNRD